MGRVAILIVTYQSGAEIGSCLDSIRHLPDVEVVVIDNASADETRHVVESRGVRCIGNKDNRGFAAAVNQGVRATNAELLLLLNPDAHLVTGLEPLIAVFQDPKVGAAGGLLIGLDERPQRGFTARRLPTPMTLIFEVLGLNRLLPWNSVNWKYRCIDLRLTSRLISGESAIDVEQPAGAFLMFSRAAWSTVGGFDEQFWPIWFEDVDFCARIRNVGFQIKLVLSSVAKHTGGHSIQELTVENRERYWYGSLLKYAAKHYRSLPFRFICAAVAVGSVFRIFPGFIRQGFRVFVVQSAVFRLALSRLLGSYR